MNTPFLPRKLTRLAALLLALAPLSIAAAEPLRVCASTTDLDSLARIIGGARVQTYCFSKGMEDPHEIELKPSFAKELNRADLYLQVGQGIENAWLEKLMRSVSGDVVKPGQKGNLNLGRNVRPLEGEAGKNAPNSFHEDGNPHYLLDPIEGLRAAREIRDKLSELRPEWKAEFAANHDKFHQRLAVALVGEECAKKDNVEKLALEFEKLKDAAAVKEFLTHHQVGGWLGAFGAHRGRFIVGDHDLWYFFARRFGLEVLGYLEPSPGVPPTTKHLQELVAKMKAKQVRVILCAPYFEQRSVEFAAKQSGARPMPMAHQTGARPRTDDYFALLKHNAEQLLAALNAKGTAAP
jgi:ABC-type Zn uptake system ZnuABC Zn-binding protein ZnuA